jgi:hypothetical protein
LPIHDGIPVAEVEEKDELLSSSFSLDPTDSPRLDADFNMEQGLTDKNGLAIHLGS